MSGITARVRVLAASLTLWAAAPALAASVVRPNEGFQETTLVPTNPTDLDDGSSGLVDLGFEVNFFRKSYRGLYVNINGNVTFDGPSAEFVADISDAFRVIIAPFFADVDLSAKEPTARVTYGVDTVDGHRAFGVNWTAVSRYDRRSDLHNTFQVVLIERSDVAAGDFDIEFNYERIEWDVSDPTNDSGPTSPPARVGFSNGTKEAGSLFELDDAPAAGTWVDANAATGLINGSRDSAAPGRYVFQVRGGTVVCKRSKECGDRIACTSDVCSPGASGADPFGCVHTPSCPGLDSQCGTCTTDRAQRKCVPNLRPDGTACDNGDDCLYFEGSTESDLCVAGKCESPAACGQTAQTSFNPNTSPSRTIVLTCGSGQEEQKGTSCEAEGVFLGTGAAASLVALATKPVTPGTVIYPKGVTAKTKLDPSTGRGKKLIRLKLNKKGQRLLKQTQGPLRVSVRFSVRSGGDSTPLLSRLVTLIGKKK